MKDPEKHPGITMHRIAVGGGIMGAVFAIGCSVIFLLGLPASRWFLLASVFVGIGVAVLLYVWHKRHPVEYTDVYEPPQPKPKN
jgi:hypothetical protein